jgi:hypothetical protein
VASRRSTPPRLTVVGAASTTTPQGLGFHPSAFVMATADLPEPKQGKVQARADAGYRQALRYWQASDIMTDQHPCRLDSIYGFKTQRPEFASASPRKGRTRTWQRTSPHSPQQSP